MLNGISPCVGPDLLAALARMGHGDEIVIADANFPGHTQGVPVIRADGLPADQLLDGVLRLIPVDTYVDYPLVMMQVVTGDTADPALESAYQQAIDRRAPDAPAITQMERHAFYDRAKSAAVIVMTGETRKYGNIIVKKGVVVADD